MSMHPSQREKGKKSYFPTFVNPVNFGIPQKELKMNFGIPRKELKMRTRKLVDPRRLARYIKPMLSRCNN